MAADLASSVAASLLGLTYLGSHIGIPWALRGKKNKRKPAPYVRRTKGAPIRRR